MASSFIKGFNLKMLVIVLRIILVSLQKNTEFSVIKAPEYKMIIKSLDYFVHALSLLQFFLQLIKTSIFFVST